MNCRICGGSTLPFGRATVLERHDVAYYRCGACGFVQTEEPYWLEEAYAGAIAGSDVGLVDRNVRLARIAQSVIRLCVDGDGTFLDYGGGYGLLVRLMRDAGYDFRLYDRYCANLFAAGFEAAPEAESGYDLVTAFEVLEHLVDPLEEMERLLSFSRTVLVTTELLPEPAPLPQQWWYYGLDHGQHVSFFTEKALRKMAEKFSLNYYGSGGSIHLLTDRTVSPLAFRIATVPAVAAIGNALFRRGSLIPADHEQACAANTRSGSPENPSIGTAPSRPKPKQE